MKKFFLSSILLHDFQMINYILLCFEEENGIDHGKNGYLKMV